MYFSMRHLESQLQRSCITWFRLQYPDIGRLCFAVPNGGARNAVEAKIMKGEGVTPGISDLILLKSNGKYSSLCIELKTGKGRQSDFQKSWQELAEVHGNKYVVCRSFDEFREVINDYIHGYQWHALK